MSNGEITGRNRIAHPPPLPAREVFASRASFTLLIVLAAAWFPPAPAPLSPHLASWIWGLNLAHSLHLAFGSDIVFTYGPLAYLNWPHFPGVSVALFGAYILGTYLVWIYGLVRFALAIHSARFRALAVALFVIAGALLNGVDDSIYLDRFELALVALAMSLTARRFRFAWLDYALLTLLTALGILLKINLGLEALIFLLPLLAATALRGPGDARRAALFLVILPLATVLLYAATGAPAAAFFRYLRLSAELAAGYSEAMSLSGPHWQLVLAAATLLVAAASLLLLQQRRALLPVAIPVCAAALLAFKHAFVRQDTHAAAFQIELAAFAFLALAAAATLRDRIVVLVFAAVSLVSGAVVNRSLGIPVAQPLLNLATLHGLHSAVAYLQLGAVASRNAAADRLSLAPLLFTPSIRAAIQPDTIDTFSLSNSFETVLANRLHWDPRPVFEGYSAWSPPLEQLNASHLRAAAAPRLLFFNWGDLDDRYPFFSEPASWRALVDQYDLAGFTASVCFLRRRPQPRYADLAPLGETVARWNQPIELPAAAPQDLLVATATIDRSIPGIAISALLRSAPIYVEAVLASGARVKGRVVRANLQNGCIVSDWPQDSQGLLALLSSPPPARNKVRSISFHSTAAWQYARAIRLHWYRARRRFDADPAALSSQPAAPSLIQLWHPARSVPLISRAEVVQLQPVLRVRPLAADATLSFHIGPAFADCKTLLVRARFGVLRDRVTLLFGTQDRPTPARAPGPVPWWSLRTLPVIDGFMGIVPAAGQRLDMWVSLTSNPTWTRSRSTVLSINPASDLGVGSVIDIEGIWGSRDALPSPDPLNEMQFYPAASTQAAGSH